MADDRVIRIPESRVVEIATGIIDRREAEYDSKIKALITATVHETLTQLGVAYQDPIQMQRDFSTLRNFRKSLAWLAAGVGGGIITVVAGLVLVALQA